MTRLVDNADIDVLRTRIRVVQQEIGVATRARRIYYQTSAGASLARVERDLADLHPPVGDPSSHAELARMCRVNDKPLGRIYNVLFKNERVIEDSDEGRAMNRVIDYLRNDMRRVVEEVRRRIGSERSLLSLVQRYRQKCQWYDADRLRALAANGPSLAELAVPTQDRRTREVTLGQN